MLPRNNYTELWTSTLALPMGDEKGQDDDFQGQERQAKEGTEEMEDRYFEENKRGWTRSARTRRIATRGKTAGDYSRRNKTRREEKQ